MKVADLKIENNIKTEIHLNENNDFYEFLVREVHKYESVFILSDNEISNKIFNKVTSLDKSKIFNINFNITSNFKSEKNVKNILDFLVKKKCNKNSLLVSLGGGSISDITGFISSIYMRGIDHIIIPTTLLSMVDASIGGKTAIDFHGIRNLIGTFNHPKKILLSLGFLNSLSKIEKINGLAEILKYSLIMDYSLFELLEKKGISIFDNKNFNVLKKIIIKCIKHKIYIVEQDQYDSSIRNILNFGHTAGHALESYYDFKISHGIGVLLGIKVAAKISLEINNISIKEYNRIIEYVDGLNLDDLEFIDINKIVELMYFDKKSETNQINYIILDGIGKAVMKKNIDIKLIKEGLSAI